MPFAWITQEFESSSAALEITKIAQVTSFTRTSATDGQHILIDVTVRNTLQPAFLAEAAVRPGMVAEAGEAAKDLHHAAVVEQAGAMFLPLVMESLGVWTPHSLETLRDIAARTITASGLTSERALTNLLQQLSVRLWQFNARMLR